MSFVARKVAGAPQIVVKRVEPEGTDPGSGGPGGNTGSASQINAVPLTGGPSNDFVRWLTPALAIDENQTATAQVSVSRVPDVPSAITVTLDSSSTINESDVTFPEEIVFKPGDEDTQSYEVAFGPNAAQGGSETCVLKLDRSAPVASGLAQLDTNDTFGAILLTITVNDAATPTLPSWELVPVSEVQEGALGVQFEVALTGGSASEDLTVTLSDTGVGSAVQGRDYTSIPASVTIPAGDTSAFYTIDFPDNSTLAPGGNETLELRGEVAPSSAVSNPAAQTFSVSITDNETAFDPTPRINFTTSTQRGPDGTSFVVTATSVNSIGQAQSFGTFAPISLTVSESAGMAGNYTVNWGANNPGTISFPPGPGVETTRATFTVNISEGVPVGESVTWTIDPPSTPGDYIRGSRNTATIEVIAEEATQLFFPAFNGASSVRRLVQGLVAVDPPSPTLPNASLSTGERVQLVGHKRDPEGNWIAAHFYGLANGDESVPDVSSTVLEYRLAEAGDTLPSEAFVTPGAPEVSFELDAANASATYTCTTGGIGVGNTLENWVGIGINSTWPQTSTSVYREKVHSLRPVKTGVTRETLNTSGDALGLIEIVEAQVAGDPDVAIFTGRFLNGAWNKTVDPFTANPYVDGEINMRSITVSCEAGYNITLGDAHPQQLDNGTSSASLLKARTEDYFFPVHASYPFAFAVYTAGDADAQARAEDYLRMKHIAWSIGKYGSTRNAIYGDESEVTLDWGRAGLQRGSQRGWAAVKAVGEAQGTEAIANWTSGTAPVSAEHDRWGWFQSIGPNKADSQGSAGNTEVYGSHGLIPWWGYWWRMKTNMFCSAMRHRLGYRDLSTNPREAGWWWNVAADQGGGAYKMPFVGVLSGSQQGSRGHYHFATARDFTAEDFWNHDPLTDLLLGPTDRDWQTPEVADPFENQIRTSYWTEAFSHIARARNGYTDMWDGCRNWLAYRQREEMAAAVSRVLAPVLPYFIPTDSNGNENAYERNNFNLAWRYEFLENNASARGLGQWSNGSDTAAMISGSPQAHAWPTLWLSSFYATTTDENRLYLRGGVPGDASHPAAGIDMMGMLWDFYEHLVQDSGVPMRETFVSQDPSPASDQLYGLTDIPNRVNATPLSPNPLAGANDSDIDADAEFGGGPVSAAGSRTFEIMFFVRAIEVLKRMVIGGAGAGQMGRLFRAQDNYINGARVFSGAGRDFSMPLVTLSAIGGQLFDSPSAASSIDRYSETQVRDGLLRWRITTPGSSTDAGYSANFFKSGWGATASRRALEADFYDYIPKDVYGAADDTDQEFVDRLMAELQQSVFSPGSGAEKQLFGEWTFFAPYLAYLLNKYS